MNQACSSRPRLCASRTAVPSGSQPGSRPWVPVRYAAHGSYGEGQNASAVGRTWSMTAFSRRSTARSSRSSSSARWASGDRPGADGQSVFATVAIHMPRSSLRCGSGWPCDAVCAAVRPEDAAVAALAAVAAASGSAADAATVAAPNVSVLRESFGMLPPEDVSLADPGSVHPFPHHPLPEPGPLRARGEPFRGHPAHGATSDGWGNGPPTNDRWQTLLALTCERYHRTSRGSAPTHLSSFVRPPHRGRTHASQTPRRARRGTLPDRRRRHRGLGHRRRHRFGRRGGADRRRGHVQLEERADPGRRLRPRHHLQPVGEEPRLRPYRHRRRIPLERVDEVLDTPAGLGGLDRLEQERRGEPGHRRPRTGQGVRGGRDVHQLLGSRQRLHPALVGPRGDLVGDRAAVQARRQHAGPRHG
ncbi:hypothetical protein SCOCK_410053 [Actinacidiphila cocklensis]|uniref:Uncharacterized protein n=1 Tax=Actinacidiphila cocklensis TaxID=887465 RepID=A0A9W4GT07_9ACTN|nr:hypothetical protein SCOCK_410053 [Actinacidiphila cocklensis]